MTRRVTDAEQDRLILGVGFRQRFCAPRIPVDRVVRVLKQIRTGFVNQRVGVFVFSHYGFVPQTSVCEGVKKEITD
jgi:hypothetical protein